MPPTTPEFLDQKENEEETGFCAMAHIPQDFL
jgi:hypothetical protein